MVARSSQSSRRHLYNLQKLDPVAIEVLDALQLTYVSKSAV